ncbi:MAG: long-chain fatty acid--CoA ligase, partial [Erythrobacter sp.]|nr:long-chain fatty acid--CoA ligase [Erythrobacter sp.]
MNVNSALAADSYHHPTPWEARFKSMTLPALLTRTVEHDPAAPFLHFMGRTYSYGDIFEDAKR